MGRIHKRLQRFAAADAGSGFVQHGGGGQDGAPGAGGLVCDDHNTNNGFLAMQTLELDPGNTVAVAKTGRLEPVVAERREKMKDEMIGEPAAC